MGVLQEIVARGGTRAAPLCLDALTARIAEQSGFELGYVSGGALGYRHAVSEALLTIDELSDVVRHVTARSRLDIIVDGGVGFGDPVHVVRAVREFEAAGAAAIEIEDQVAPKRVSHHRGIEHLISADEMRDKVRYAVDARRSDDFLVIARTGAVHNESFDAACERANLYLAAGADLALIMPETRSDWARVSDLVEGPLVTFGALGGRTLGEWQALGFTLVLDPFTAQVLEVQAIREAYRRFADFGESVTPPEGLMDTYRELAGIAGLDEYYAIEDATTERTP